MTDLKLLNDWFLKGRFVSKHLRMHCVLTIFIILIGHFRRDKGVQLFPAFA